MVSMEINKATVWYSNPIDGGTVPVVDENGLMTGEYVPAYTDPVSIRAALSESIGLNNLTAQGVAELKNYGIATNYTHRMITEDMDCPVTEESILWYGIEPGTRATDVPYNFRVVRVSKTLNYKTYYLRQVDVDIQG